MTPKGKRTLATWLALATAIVALAAAIKPIVRPIAKTAIVSTLDSTYVTQQSYATDNLVDSLTHKQEVDSIFRMFGSVKASQARADSSLRCLRKRKPAWCGE